MRDRNPQEQELGLDGYQSQVLFEMSFPVGHIPLIDTRTPAAVASGLSPQEWRELNG